PQQHQIAVEVVSDRQHRGRKDRRGCDKHEATMANDVIDFQSRRAAREAERAEYDAYHRRVVAIFKMMSPVIACAQELGADNRAIASALRAIVEELEAVQSGPPDAAS